MLSRRPSAPNVGNSAASFNVTFKQPSLKDLSSPSTSLRPLSTSMRPLAKSLSAPGPLTKRASSSASSSLARSLSLANTDAEKHVTSTWKIGSREAKVNEKKPHSHRLSSYYYGHFDTQYETIAKEKNLRLLESLFHEADEDGSGTMDLEEFTKSLNDEGIRKAFGRLGVQPHQCGLVFKTLDANGTGELTVGEFIGGLHGVVGNVDFNAQASELDVAMLSAGNRQRIKKRIEENEKANGAKSFIFPPLDARGDNGDNSRQKNKAFIHAAMSLALHPATARK